MADTNTNVVTNQKLFDTICEKINAAVEDLKSDVAEVLDVEYGEEDIEEVEDEDDDDDEV